MNWIFFFMGSYFWFRIQTASLRRLVLVNSTLTQKVLLGRLKFTGLVSSLLFSKSNVCLPFYAETKSSFLMQNMVSCHFSLSPEVAATTKNFRLNFWKIFGHLFSLFVFLLAGTPYTKTKETYTYRTIDNALFIILVAFAAVGILYALFCLLTLALNFKKK